MDAARAGKWNQTTLGHTYNTTPSSSTLCWTHDWQSPKHYLPKHGILVPPDAIKAMMYTTVIQLNDGNQLDIVKAKKWVETNEVRLTLMSP